MTIGVRMEPVIPSREIFSLLLMHREKSTERIEIDHRYRPYSRGFLYRLHICIHILPA
jgi:hypothetical protein